MSRSGHPNSGFMDRNGGFGSFLISREGAKEQPFHAKAQRRKDAKNSHGNSGLMNRNAALAHSSQRPFPFPLRRSLQAFVFIRDICGFLKESGGYF